MQTMSNEQTLDLQTAHPVDTEGNLGASQQKADVSLGKFKDAKELLNAYNSLQAEFTKRCQRLKELEGKALDDKTTVPSKDKGEEPLVESKGTTQQDKQDILKEYLKEIMGSKQTAVLMDGGGVGITAPVKKPASILEAGRLAKEIF